MSHNAPGKKKHNKQNSKNEINKKNSNMPNIAALQAFELEKSTKGVRTSGLEESSVTSAVGHIKDFDAIMTAFAENARKGLIYNRRYKRIYFYGSILVLLVITVGTVYCLLHPYWFETPTDYIAPVASFMTAFIVLPITISKYLFNPQETHDLNEIVKSIQEHDRKMTGHDTSSADSTKKSRSDTISICVSKQAEEPDPMDKPCA